MDEIFHEQGDVGPTLAQGRHVQRDHVQPIEEIRLRRAA